MQVCFASDFHGSYRHYDEFGALVRGVRPDVVILGGDMFPDGDSADPGGSQAMFIPRELQPRIESWQADLPDLAVALLMGNHDWTITEAAARELEEGGLLTVLDPRRPWRHLGVTFLGYPYAPPAPFWVKDYERLDLDDSPLPEMDGAVWDSTLHKVQPVTAAEHFRGRASIASDLATIAEVAGPWVLVAHTPPFDTKLDRLPGLPHPIGSRAIRAFIEQRRPLCALHGHVHESPATTGSYFDDVGGVLCINPGQSHDRLYAVSFDTTDPRGTLRHNVLG